MLISLGAYRLVCEQVGLDEPLGLQRCLMWCLAIFCGATHKPENALSYETLAPALPKLALCFYQNDEVLLTHALSALQHAIVGLSQEPRLLERLGGVLIINSQNNLTVNYHDLLTSECFSSR